MKIELDEQMMRGVVSEAILISMDQQKRDILIQGAIQHLMTPQSSGSYGRSVSPIQEAFNGAVRDFASQIAGDMLKADETVLPKIQGLITEAVAVLTDRNREATVQRIADSIEKGIAGDRY